LLVVVEEVGAVVVDVAAPSRSTEALSEATLPSMSVPVTVTVAAVTSPV